MTPLGNIQPEWNQVSQALTFSNASSLIKKAWYWEVEKYCFICKKKAILVLFPERIVVLHISTSGRISWTKNSVCKIIGIYGYKQRQTRVKDTILTINCTSHTKLSVTLCHLFTAIYVCSQTKPTAMQYMHPITTLLLKTQDRTKAIQYFYQLITHLLCEDPIANQLGIWRRRL